MARQPITFQAKVATSDAYKESRTCESAIPSMPVSGSVRKLFGDFTNCTIGSININIQPSISTDQHNEFDAIVKSMDLTL